VGKALEDTWDRIRSWLAANASEVLASLAPPATDAQLHAADSAMGVELPAEVRACYRIHNGQRPVLTPRPSHPPRRSVPAFLYGDDWLSLDKMVEHWRMMKGLLDDEVFKHPGLPRGPVRPVWWDPCWLPLTENHSGYMKCLDLAPTAGGRVGQILWWCHDDPSRGVAALSFGAWLAAFAEKLEAGEYTTAPDVYGPGLVRISDL
jgi:cell wall assembly regulator SMI1